LPQVCYHPAMRSVALLLALLAIASPAGAADPLAEARRLYNRGQYEAAERMAKEAVQVQGQSDGARIVLGRVQLERHRQTGDMADLEAARESLRSVDPRPLDAGQRIELLIGLAEALYLENRFGAAAALFDSVSDASASLGTSAHERVLDWWATSLDRYAQTRPVEERQSIYTRIATRMNSEIVLHPGSTPAGYWLAAAARAGGDPEIAWQHAFAGWVRAALAEDRGAALRADLDRLVVQAIIPERAAKLAGRSDSKLAQSGMVSEWEAFKAGWSK
jgi:hypothetical protein